jgi:hypothetical protein
MANVQKAIFPMKCMNISQSYDEGNHIPHWQGASKNKADYPIDICGENSGKDVFVAPCNCKITMIQAKNTSKWTNKMILVSTGKVKTPKYGITQIFFKVVHFPYDNVKKYGLKVGKTFKKGEVICTEGKDDFSTGNHIHLSQGIGYADKSIYNKPIYKKNRKLVANGDNKYPQSIFYLDTNFTKKIKRDAGIKWSKI